MTSEEMYQFLGQRLYIAHRVYSKGEDVVVFAESPAEARSKAKEYFEKTNTISDTRLNYISVFPAEETDIPYIFKIGLERTS